MSAASPHFIVSLACALCPSLACAISPNTQVGSDAPEPRCGGPFSPQLERTLRKQGAPKTYTYFPNDEFEHQLARYPNSICPEAALRQAILALLLDDAKEALGTVARESGKFDCGALCAFNSTSSLFGIVADRYSYIQNQLLPSAPSLESLEAHWVFFLSVPDLSEHGYWALVARDGSGVEVVSRN